MQWCPLVVRLVLGDCGVLHNGAILRNSAQKYIPMKSRGKAFAVVSTGGDARAR